MDSKSGDLHQATSASKFPGTKRDQGPKIGRKEDEPEVAVEDCEDPDDLEAGGGRGMDNKNAASPQVAAVEAGNGEEPLWMEADFH